MTDLNHFDSNGNARMVDVGSKPIGQRMARARADVCMNERTGQTIRERKTFKGDVLNVARIAGISGSKWTPHLIPMCHPLPVDAVTIEFSWSLNSPPSFDTLSIFVNVKTTGKTGVEMEALTAASISALTVYDMCKSIDREMEIQTVHLVEKSGGNSGDFKRHEIISDEE